jgi:hypothetical protein
MGDNFNYNVVLPWTKVIFQACKQSRDISIQIGVINALQKQLRMIILAVLSILDIHIAYYDKTWREA